MKKYLQFGLIVVIVVLAIFILGKVSFKSGVQQESIINVEKGNLPPLGQETAAITIIEFGDYLCPFCGRAVLELYPQIENLIKDGKVAIYFRDFVVHPQAMIIHNAARCANEQNKFWEFNENVFKKFMNGEDTSKKEVLLNLAKELNLNLENFEKCLSENKYLAEIQKDLQDGIKAGVEGTPTFFINGQKIVGIDIPKIMSTINSLLK